MDFTERRSQGHRYKNLLKSEKKNVGQNVLFWQFLQSGVGKQSERKQVIFRYMYIDQSMIYQVDMYDFYQIDISGSLRGHFKYKQHLSSFSEECVLLSVVPAQHILSSLKSFVSFVSSRHILSSVKFKISENIIITNIWIIIHITIYDFLIIIMVKVTSTH